MIFCSKCYNSPHETRNNSRPRTCIGSERRMKITPELTDSAVLHELGERLSRRRIDAGLTQAELAHEAGVSKRSVERIEAGESTDFRILLRVMRVLKLLDILEQSLPD